jgi:hypothetical protein
MSMQSSVGNAQIHEANEQRCVLCARPDRKGTYSARSPNPNEDNSTRFEEGKPNAHAQGDIVYVPIPTSPSSCSSRRAQ